ncbi:MAG: hypothetical protein FWC51_01775 [Proteobacteria bacterium]|nr:hypothetical protein [Pseudomonadota bacterium]
MIINKVETRRGFREPLFVYFLSIAAIIGIGVLLGYLMFGARPPAGGSRMTLSDDQCMNLSGQINRAISYFSDTQPSSDTTAAKVAQLKALNTLYNANCRDRKAADASGTVSAPDQTESKLPDRTCEAIEVLKQKYMAPENSDRFDERIMNARIYSDLFKYGCPENLDRWKGLAIRELEIAHALMGGDTEEWFDSTRLIYQNLNVTP